MSNPTGQVLPWLGQTPAYWEIKPLHALGCEVRALNRGLVEDNLLSLSYGEIKRKDIEANIGLLPESFETYQIVEAGDMVFRFTDLQNDQKSLRSGLVKERGIITNAYVGFRPKGIDSRYFNYLMRVYDWAGVFYSMGSGLRQSLKYSDVRRLPVIVPPLAEQRRIADWLDERSVAHERTKSEIDVVRKLLWERRKTAFQAKLARYLEGELPSSFQEVPLGRIAHLVSRKGLAEPFVGLENIESHTGRILPVQGATETGQPPQETPREESIARPGEVLFGRLRPYLAKAGVVEEACRLGGDILALQPLRCSSQFLKFLLLSPDFLSYAEAVSTGTKMPRCSWDNMKTFKFSLPSVSIQAKLVAEMEGEDMLALAVEDSLLSLSEVNAERKKVEQHLCVTGRVRI